MKAVKTILLVLLVIFGVKMVAKGIMYSNAEDKVGKGQTYQAPVSFGQEFMDACVKEGGAANQSYCQCTLDYMQTHLGDAGLQAVSLKYMQTNTIQPEMTEAATACIDNYVAPPPVMTD